MKIEQIEQCVRDIYPNASQQECADFIQVILEVLDGIQSDSLEKYPSMNKWINDSFQMVRELTREFYGTEYKS